MKYKNPKVHPFPVLRPPSSPSFFFLPFLLFLSFFLLLPLFLYAQLPSDFSDQIVSEEFNQPMGFVFDDNGRMYVWEKDGKVWIVDENGEKRPNPLLDISEETGNWRDHGLLGFALDPAFLTNGRIYLLYDVDRHYLLYHGTPQYDPDSTASHQASIARLTRYTADPGDNFESVLPNSRKILIGESVSTGIPQIHESHGVGTLLFGTDGTLLVSNGDGGSNKGVDTGGDELDSYASEALATGIFAEDEDIGSYRSQYLGSLNGKILRLDPETGDGVPGNPFYDPEQPRSAQSRTWVIGLRNPFRMVLVPDSGSHNPEDANPGTLYLGDVGSASWEELNIVTQGGQNFGWPLVEGFTPHWGFWNGPVPDNQLAPNPLFGIGGCEDAYFDFKEMFAQVLEGGNEFFPNPCDANQAIPAELFPSVEAIPAIAWSHNEWNLPIRTQVGVFNENGRIEGTEIIDPVSKVEGDNFGGNSSIAGTFYRGDAFPEVYDGAYFQADFSGWIKVFFFDENHILQKVEPFHEESKAIIHLAQHPTDGCLYYISLKDNGKIRKICYGGNPPPVAVAKADTIYGPSPLTVHFDAGESYDPFGLPITYQWDFADGTGSSEEKPVHTFTTNNEGPTPFEVVLTVTDSLGVSASTSLVIALNNTPPAIEIISPQDSSLYPVTGTTFLNLQATVEDLEHDESELDYEWQVFLHHNTHFHTEEPVFEKSPVAIITAVGCEGIEAYWYRIRLIVSDGAGLESVAESEIFPFCGPPFFEIADLSGEATEKTVQLQWISTEEEGVETYEIQRTPDFSSIGTVPATGAGSYQFTDDAPSLGTNHYRLKVINEAGVYDYSNIISLDFPPKAEVHVYPNPANNIVYIELKKARSSELTFELFNATGQSLSTTTWNPAPDLPFTAPVVTNSLPNGIYFYKIKNGSHTEHGIIAVQR